MIGTIAIVFVAVNAVVADAVVADAVVAKAVVALALRPLFNTKQKSSISVFCIGCSELTTD